MEAFGVLVADVDEKPNLSFDPWRKFAHDDPIVQTLCHTEGDHMALPADSAGAGGLNTTAPVPPTHLFDYDAQLTIHVLCPVCQTDNPSESAFDRLGYRIGVSRCTCGLQYLNPRMTLEGYYEFYKSGTYRRLAEAHYSTTPEQHARGKRRQGEDIAIRLRMTGVHEVKHLLDAGGSDGVVTAHVLRTVPCTRVTIWDPAPTELALARQRGYQTVQGMLEARPSYLVGAFDGIICGQTIEHLCTPLIALRSLRELGTGWLWVDMLTGCPWKIDHPLYWTDASLRLAFEKTGWTPRAIFKMSKRGQTGYLCD